MVKQRELNAPSKYNVKVCKLVLKQASNNCQMSRVAGWQ